MMYISPVCVFPDSPHVSLIPSNPACLREASLHATGSLVSWEKRLISLITRRKSIFLSPKIAIVDQDSAPFAASSERQQSSNWGPLSGTSEYQCYGGK
jgi:hypothetical protein